MATLVAQAVPPGELFVAVTGEVGRLLGADLTRRMPIPIEHDVAVGRLPAVVEATAYFVVAEALTNVAKHAHARHAKVTVRTEDGTLHMHIRDDGVGGAQPDGSGLLGLGDRLAPLDGQLRIDSPPGGGTLVAAAIPSQASHQTRTTRRAEFNPRRRAA